MTLNSSPVSRTKLWSVSFRAFFVSFYFLQRGYAVSVHDPADFCADYSLIQTRQSTVNSMKLLTLNTHSLLETDYEHKLSVFIHFLLRERPDVVALQEVNQTISASPAEYAQRIGFLPAPGSAVPAKQGNHALRIAAALYEAGVPCSWTYLPVKTGYDRYDEGLALLSLSGRISAVEACPVSLSRDYRNWRSRMALGIQIENRSEWFYSVHMC